MKNLYGIGAGRKTLNNRLLSRGYHAYIPTRKFLPVDHPPLCLKWSQRWQSLTMAHWQYVIVSDESRFQLVDGRFRVHHVPGECLQQKCQAYRVQVGGGLVHVWGAFHSGAKSHLVLSDRHPTDELYMGNLQNTLVPFTRQHFGDNYQDDHATPHHARVFFDFLQQSNVTKMEQPAILPDCNPI